MKVLKVPTKVYATINNWVDTGKGGYLCAFHVWKDEKGNLYVSSVDHCYGGVDSKEIKKAIDFQFSTKMKEVIDDNLKKGD